MNENSAKAPANTLSAEHITLRRVTPDDHEFLLLVYAAAREIELSRLPWDDAQKGAFLEHQFAAQTAHYATEFPLATHEIILLDDQPVGRVYVERGADQITILDLTVLSQFRKNGIATVLISGLLNEGQETQRTVGVCIETFNPSRDFFAKRGFEVVSDDGANLRMRWTQ